MDAKSHDSDELHTLMLNSLETLSKKVEKLEEQVKKQNELSVVNSNALVELNKTVITTNKIFDQVSQGVKDLYDKVKSLELIGKMMGNLGALGPLFGGGQKPGK